mmetsp:Transcript_13458/g.30454  ORF Transcript_13458/g.30454 Transcript_13458/m.30454 type:complete len:208 (-) Transcript_13458:34-657(-)
MPRLHLTGVLVKHLLRHNGGLCLLLLHGERVQVVDLVPLFRRKGDFFMPLLHVAGVVALPCHRLTGVLLVPLLRLLRVPRLHPTGGLLLRVLRLTGVLHLPLLHLPLLHLHGVLLMAHFNPTCAIAISLVLEYIHSFRSHQRSLPRHEKRHGSVQSTVRRPNPFLATRGWRRERERALREGDGGEREGAQRPGEWSHRVFHRRLLIS